ncbi:hypothetical protein HC248_01311 [Polaromonas vacuolata]|uniref:Uncharacterized protein n=1 Tax=Polaromonas vacuolata TaxID=37448 RepID=A0A6H2H8C9_9BURK|nr:hypothetical protein HC248_01311 [Polaromonas vacuolata]
MKAKYTLQKAATYLFVYRCGGSAGWLWGLVPTHFFLLPVELPPANQVASTNFSILRCALLAFGSQVEVLVNIFVQKSTALVCP